MSVDCEDTLRDQGDIQEADVLKILREYFDVYNTSGISDSTRISYVNSFLNWFEPLVLKDFYSIKLGQYIKANIQEDLDESYYTDYHPSKKSQVLPMNLVESLVIVGYSFLSRMHSTAKLQSNIDYDLQATEPSIALFQERAYSSMDVEGKFSLFNAIAKRDGRAHQGSATASQAAQCLKKLVILDHHNHHFNFTSKSTYCLPTYYKTIEELKEWKVAHNRIRKADTANSQKRIANKRKYTSLSTGTSLKAIRDYHRSDGNNVFDNE